MALFFFTDTRKTDCKNYKEIEGTYNNQNNLEKKRTCLPHPDPPSHLTLHPLPPGAPKKIINVCSKCELYPNKGVKKQKKIIIIK